VLDEVDAWEAARPATGLDTDGLGADLKEVLVGDDGFCIVVSPYVVWRRRDLSPPLS
jgi:hypothetical protein